MLLWEHHSLEAAQQCLFRSIDRGELPQHGLSEPRHQDIRPHFPRVIFVLGIMTRGESPNQRLSFKRHT